jgi:predicted ATPase with chaperone activity
VNAHVPAGALLQCVPLNDDALEAWHGEADTRGLTGRGAARIRRVARTLADLDDVDAVSASHISLAAMLREDVP